MESSTPTPIETIQRISARMKFAYKALIAVVSVLVVLSLATVFGDVGTIYITDWALRINLSDLGDLDFDRDVFWHMSSLSAGAKFLVVLYVFTAGGFSILALAYVHALFVGFADAQIFTATSVRLIRRIGLFLLMGAALPVPLYAITKLLRYLIVDLPLQNDLMSNFSLNPLWLFLVVAGFSVLVISRVMESGLELREERDLTI